MIDNWEMLRKQLDDLPVGIEHAYLRKEMEKFYPKWKLLEERLNTHFAGNIEDILKQNKDAKIAYNALYEYVVSDNEKFGDDIDTFVNLTFSKSNIEVRKNTIKECKNFYEEVSETITSIAMVRKDDAGGDFLWEVLTFFGSVMKHYPSSTFLRLKAIFESYESMSEQVKTKRRNNYV